MDGPQYKRTLSVSGSCQEEVLSPHCLFVDMQHVSARFHILKRLVGTFK